MHSWLVWRVPLVVFLAIEDGMLMIEIYKASKIAYYAWIIKVIDIIERAGLCWTERETKYRRVYLTEKGRKLQKLLEAFR